MKANINWITDQVATGGDFSFNPDKALSQLADLLSQDIDLVIDCRQEAEDGDIWDDTDVSYLHLPTNDAWGWEIPPEHFDKAVEAALPVIQGGGKVFVHCHMGINRGPSTAFGVLLALGVPSAKAFDLIRAKRPQAGLVYAVDALKAHLKRKGHKPSHYEWQRRVRRLESHIDTVMTRKERQSIQRVIRQGHEQDRRDLALS